MEPDPERARRQAAWELLVDLVTTVLPDAAGGTWPDARALFIAETNRAAPLLGTAGPGVASIVREAVDRLDADENDREAWSMLYDLHTRLETISGGHLPARPHPAGKLTRVYGLTGH